MPSYLGAERNSAALGAIQEQFVVIVVAAVVGGGGGGGGKANTWLVQQNSPPDLACTLVGPQWVAKCCRPGLRKIMQIFP